MHFICYSTRYTAKLISVFVIRERLREVIIHDHNYGFNAAEFMIKLFSFTYLVLFSEVVWNLIAAHICFLNQQHYQADILSLHCLTNVWLITAAVLWDRLYWHLKWVITENVRAPPPICRLRQSDHLSAISDNDDMKIQTFAQPYFPPVTLSSSVTFPH